MTLSLTVQNPNDAKAKATTVELPAEIFDVAVNIPLIHQVAVAGPFRRQGVATMLMDAAEQLARDRGIATLGITVGLSGEYGPAQQLYGRRGYVPDGRGACQGQRPLRKGMLVTMDDDLIIWLTKHLAT